MSRHERAEAEIVIQIFVAIEIAEMAALRILDKDRIRIISPVIAGNTQRQTLQVFLMRLGGLRGTTLERVELFLQCGVHRVSSDDSGRVGH